MMIFYLSHSIPLDWLCMLVLCALRTPVHQITCNGDEGMMIMEHWWWYQWVPYVSNGLFLFVGPHIDIAWPALYTLQLPPTCLLKLICCPSWWSQWQNKLSPAVVMETDANACPQPLNLHNPQPPTPCHISACISSPHLNHWYWIRSEEYLYSSSLSKCL